MVVALKVPMLKPCEYELWRMRMEQYIRMIDYSLWEVIENGNAPPITKVVEGVETTIAPATAKEKAQSRLELKARSTLLMGIPNEHQLNLTPSNMPSNCCRLLRRDQTFDRLQKLINQLEIHGESILQEDVNQKFLRSLSPEWNTYTIVLRNKPEIDTLSLDDLYNNLKIYEPEVKGTSSSSSSINTQNVAFVSLNSTSSTNGAANTAHNATTASTQAIVVNSITIDNLSDVVIYGLEVADGYANNEGKEILEEHYLEEPLERKLMLMTVLIEQKKVPPNFALLGLTHLQGSNSEVINGDHLREVAITELRRKLELPQKQKDEIQLTVENFKNSSKSLSKLIDCQIVDKCKIGLGYNVVPPPYTGNFMPPKPDLSFSGLEEFVNEPIDWVSNNEEEDVPQAKIEIKTFKPSFAKIEFVKPKQQEKIARKTANHVDCKKVNQKQFQNTKPIWNNAKRVNHQNFAKKTHSCPKKNIVPRAVLMKFGLVSVNTVRQVNAAHSKTTVNAARPMSYLSKIVHSTVKRPIHKNTAFKNGNFNQRVNTVKDKNVNAAKPKAVVNAARPNAVVNVVKGNNVNAVKASTDDKKKVTEEPGKEVGDPSKDDERYDQKKDASVNSTNNVNVASTNKVNAVGRKGSIELPDEPNMTALEDIVYSDDDEDVGAEADMNNLDTTIQVSHIPTTRIHKDHPVEQIIKDLNLASQIRRMTKNLEEHGLFSLVQQRTNHKDFQNFLFACFLSQEKPKKVIHALKDPSWIEGTKWVFRNKKDKRGIVIKNKARLVAQGYTQEEGIDYDEVFDPVSRIEAIRLFLAYASFKYFVVYQMDVMSAFLYGKIEEEVYVCQPPGFEDPDFPDKVYKVKRHYMDYIKLLELGTASKAKGVWDFYHQDKYVTEILMKFSVTDLKTAAHLGNQKLLLKDKDGEEVDVHII
ncbi:ribonuclease H-like domain-containing protein [Tanacetum coccineum]